MMGFFGMEKLTKIALGKKINIIGIIFATLHPSHESTQKCNYIIQVGQP